MKTVRTFFIAFAAAALLIVTGTPANASATAYAPGATGHAYFSGSFITVCDDRVDGRKVRAHLRNIPGGTIFLTGWAPSQGCTREGHPNTYDFRVCAEYVGCSNWVRKNS